MGRPRCAGGPPIDPLTVARCRSPRRQFNKEFRFRVLGSLEGKQVLDVSCGDGTNAVLLASLGAIVTGIDVSPKAIELAARRAELSGVAGRTRFLCSPLETAELAPHSFDLIWGDAILHHMLAELDQALRKLAGWAKASGTLLFSEPVNFNRTLRRIRAAPRAGRNSPARKIHCRPAHRAVHHARPAGPFPADQLQLRAVLLAAIDYAALRIPGLASFAGTAVLYGQPPV